MSEPPDELTYLRDRDVEYRTTLRVLAVVLERLGGARKVYVTQADLADSPDLHAHLEDGLIVLEARR